MLATLKNAFKIKELREKIFFTFAMLVVIRIGSQLPVPGVNSEYFKSWFAGQSNGAFGFLDAIYHIFYYSTAAYHCDSQIGRNAA